LGERWWTAYRKEESPPTHKRWVPQGASPRGDRVEQKIPGGGICDEAEKPRSPPLVEKSRPPPGARLKAAQTDAVGTEGGLLPPLPQLPCPEGRFFSVIKGF